MLEMKTVLRTVLSSVTVLPASKRMERPRWRSVIVTPHAGSRVVLGPRDHRPGRSDSRRSLSKTRHDDAHHAAAVHARGSLPES
jgi:hypothetical protein